MNGRPLRWLRTYYLLTVAFALADWIFGANVRAVGFAAYPGLRAAYYLSCLLCAVVIRLRPRWAALVTLGESSVNLVALMTSVLLPYYQILDQVAGGGALPGSPVTPAFLVNFGIAGGVALAVHHHALRAARGSLGILARERRASP